MIAAKAVATVVVGVASMVVAFAIGALGNLVGTAITGTPRSGTSRVADLLDIVLANVLGMLIGFMLGVLIRNSAGAIVGYFVYTFVLPTLSALLAANASLVARPPRPGSTSTSRRARCSTATWPRRTGPTSPPPAASGWSSPWPSGSG